LAEDNKSNNSSNRLGSVDLQLDDDIDAKLSSNTVLSKPNSASIAKPANTNNNSDNKKELIWGESAAIKKEETKTQTRIKPSSDVNLTKITSPKQTQTTSNLETENIKTENLKDTPALKIAQNQNYTADPPLTTPKPLPKPPTAAKLNKQNNDKQNNDKQNNDTYLLKSSRVVGTIDLVETLLEVTGDVKQLDNEQATKTEKIEVVAGFRYEERLHESSDKSKQLASIRQYNLAKAKMKIGKDVKTPEIKDKTRTIVSNLDGEKVVLFSPNGALRGEELLLVEDLPGNTLTLERLLPDKAVKVGDSWQISDVELRSFLSIDSVTESRVEAVLTAVADDIAVVEVVGEVQGIYLGAETKMSVQAKYQFDLNIQRINWLGILIQEDRSVGHVGPGFDLVARLQVKISPTKEPRTLTDEFVSEIKMQANDHVLGLKYDGGKGAWRFSHDRSWYVFQDDPQTTVLRRLHNGELVAQCNIADMGTVDVKTMTTLDRFTKEISGGLGKSYRSVVAAEEHTNEAGYKVYTVMIDGVVDDLPLRWIYNLITDKDGRQSVVVFVIEARMLKVFGDSDDLLLNTYRMIKQN
jgi:hypothetical protein